MPCIQYYFVGNKEKKFNLFATSMKQPHLTLELIRQAHFHSFDVFDTALTRIWAKPTDLFWELGIQLQKAQLIQMTPETWQRLRDDVENILRRASPTGEVKLSQIYRQLGSTCGWSSAEAEKAMQHEIQLEIASLRVVPANQRKIQALHCQNQPIAFLSDMHLSSETIQSFLQDHQLWAEGDGLYVSNEVGVNKGSGKLFQYYLTQHQLKASQLCHTGDNLYSDIKVPKKLGIQVQPFLETHLNRYEGLIADNEQLPLRFRSLLAGASRLCRLHCQETDLHRQVIWNTAANVIAPVFFGFVHWVLQEAQRQGIRRLYFMARDGQILWKIAQIICRKWGYDIDCQYFYGSRQAFHFPSIQQIGETEEEWLFDKPPFFSVRLACDRVNIQPEQIGDALRRHGLSAQMWDKNLTEQQFTALKAAFQDREIIDRIVDLAAIYREKAIGYFKQSGIGDGTSFAIVDSGWTGRSQRSFSQILAIANLYPDGGVPGFYFGLERRITPFSIDRLIPYFLEPDAITERRSLNSSPILELFLAAEHGSTVRYEKQDHHYIPILRSEKNERSLEWGVLVQQQAILDFTERLTEHLQPEECEVKYFHQVTEYLLRTFIHSPNKEEAQVFGSQPFSDQQLEGKFHDLAPAYSLVDGFRMMFDKHYVSDFVWLPASIQRSAPLTKIVLRYIKGLRDSLNYAGFARQAYLAGKEQLSWDLVKKAVQSCPAILLSRSFIRTNVSLFARSRLSSKGYN
jgi:FMN phosphatase YigB (HAD superfamily)